MIDCWDSFVDSVHELGLEFGSGTEMWEMVRWLIIGIPFVDYVHEEGLEILSLNP